MMMPGDVKVVGERLYNVLTKPPKFENPPAPQAPSVTVAGSGWLDWSTEEGRRFITWCSNRAAEKLTGTHHAEFD